MNQEVNEYLRVFREYIVKQEKYQLLLQNYEDNSTDHLNRVQVKKIIKELCDEFIQMTFPENEVPIEHTFNLNDEDRTTEDLCICSEIIFYIIVSRGQKK